jgi:hypothetical protein
MIDPRPSKTEPCIPELARRSADALRDRDLFGDKLPTIPALLGKLNLSLRAVRGLQVRGLLARGREVVVREELSEVQRRFVILHEIGHAVLLRDYPDVADKLESKLHEEFAFNFATCMLLTDQEKLQLTGLFSKLDSPSDLVKAAQFSRLPLAFLLQMPRTDEACLKGSDKLWLRCRFAANRYTRKDMKLRIVGAQYDSDRWYLPTNKGFESVFGDSKWLSDIRIGEERQRSDVEMKVHYMVNRPKQKYSLKKARGTIRALALRPVKGEEKVGFLILAVPQEAIGEG